VESALEEHGSECAGGKVREIKFFRGAMFNMISIALSDLPGGVLAVPSRSTYALYEWIEEREREVYPKMKGYKESLGGGLTTGGDGDGASFDIRTPVKLPDALRGEKYAFVSLPVGSFLEGGDINEGNIGVGRLCPIPSYLKVRPSLRSLPRSTHPSNPLLPPQINGDEFIFGIVVLSRRSTSLAQWMAGTEISHLRCDLKRRTLLMESDISTQYLMAKLDGVEREEGLAFEEGKERMGGIHFLCVQKDDDSEEPDGFWLLRDVESGRRGGGSGGGGGGGFGG